jgi:DNA polymerase alpha-associated DNA helicase A
MDDAMDRLERVVLRPQPQAKNEDEKTKWTPERTKLVEVLLGLSPLSPLTAIDELKFFDPSLNPSQKAAVKFAMAAPELACIHGPPGKLTAS